MGDFVPRIQERLRKEGFPHFAAKTITAFQMDAAAGSASIKQQTLPRWEFANGDRSWLVILTQEAVTLATSKYQSFEEPFEKYFRLALSSTADAAGLQLTTRVGLRYVDLIDPAEGSTFSDYLHPRLLEFPAEEIDIANAQSFIQTRGTTSVGTMVVRCVYLSTGHSVPPDLADLELAARLAVRPGKKVAILDFDHFCEWEDSYELDRTINRLGELHDDLDGVFRAAVTPTALDHWGNQSAPKRRRKAMASR